MGSRRIMLGVVAVSLGLAAASPSVLAADESAQASHTISAAGQGRSPGDVVRTIAAISPHVAPGLDAKRLGIFGPISSGQLSGAAVDGTLPDAELFSEEGPVRWLERYTLEGLSIERTHAMMQRLFGDTAGVRVDPPAFVL